MVFLGLSSWGAGLSRVNEKLGLFGDGLPLIQSLTFWVGVVGTILSMYGSYKKAKKDPSKKKLALCMIGILIVIALFVVSIEMYLFFRE